MDRLMTDESFASSHQHPFITKVKPQSKEIVAGLVQRYNRVMAERRSQRDEKKVHFSLCLSTLPRKPSLGSSFTGEAM
jgi:hypothetical protein